MLISPTLLAKIKNSDHVVWAGLSVFVVVWFIYKHGLVDGLKISASYTYLLALFCLGISIAMAFLLRQPVFGRAARFLLGFVSVYLITSLALDWSNLLFLSIIGAVGGLFVGVVSATTSLYHRWR